jgi:hypothetical protein
VTWVFLGIAIAALAALARWVLRSFRRWGPTDSERRSFFWGRRGGGDM